MVKKILFRADGNANTGLGHLYRLFGLIEIVKDNFEIFFLTKEESTIGVVPVEYNVVVIPKNITIDQEPKWINKNFPSSSYSIIADGYHFDSSYQSTLKQFGFKLIYIDDLANKHMFADLVINHSPIIKEIDYKKEPYTKLALGTSYALLRPKFLEETQKKREFNNIIDVAFVCFGGADPFNLTIKAVEALFALDNIKHTHVVLGNAYKHQGLHELKKENPKTLSIHRNLSEYELATIMKLTNIAIVPASTILYELCCVKMPVFSGFYVDNQELIYKGFLNKGAIYGGGNMKDYKKFDFIYYLKRILDIRNHDSIIESQGMLFDNKIKERHINLIKQIC